MVVFCLPTYLPFVVLFPLLVFTYLFSFLACLNNEVMKRGEQLIHTLSLLPTLQRSYVMKLERHHQNTSIIRKSKLPPHHSPHPPHKLLFSLPLRNMSIVRALSNLHHSNPPKSNTFLLLIHLFLSYFLTFRGRGGLATHGGVAAKGIHTCIRKASLGAEYTRGGWEYLHAAPQGGCDDGRSA